MKVAKLPPLPLTFMNFVFYKLLVWCKYSLLSVWFQSTRAKQETLKIVPTAALSCQVGAAEV